MKLLAAGVLCWRLGRSPCGERGLKSLVLHASSRRTKSLPVRGAWIEIFRRDIADDVCFVAPRAGSVD